MHRRGAGNVQDIGKPTAIGVEAVSRQHNDMAKETHLCAAIFVTRRGAVSARRGEPGSIPGARR